MIIQGDGMRYVIAKDALATIGVAVYRNRILDATARADRMST